MDDTHGPAVMGTRLYCDDVIKLLVEKGYPVESCCESCHQDSEEGYGPMIELYSDWDGASGEICCAVSRSLEDHKEVILGQPTNDTRL